MGTFVALYRGRTIAESTIVAVSSDPALVADFAARLLQQPAQSEDTDDDPVLKCVEQGRRKALRTSHWRCLMIAEAPREPTPNQRAAWTRLWLKLLAPRDEDDLQTKGPASAATDQATDHRGDSADGHDHSSTGR